MEDNWRCAGRKARKSIIVEAVSKPPPRHPHVGKRAKNRVLAFMLGPAQNTLANRDDLGRKSICLKARQRERLGSTTRCRMQLGPFSSGHPSANAFGILPRNSPPADSTVSSLEGSNLRDIGEYQRNVVGRFPMILTDRPPEVGRFYLVVIVQRADAS